MSKAAIKRYFDKEEEPTERTLKRREKKKLNNIEKKKVQDVIQYNVKVKKNFKVKQPFNKLTKTRGREVEATPLDPALIAKYTRGKPIEISNIRTRLHKERLKHKEKNYQFAVEQAARVESLLTEDVGYLETDDGETTTQFTQQQIADRVSMAAAAKCFELKMSDFGPYGMRYTRNGRHLLMAGKKGHVAAFDWITKQMHCEFNVMDEIHDMCWLHVETMFAVAQKEWVYMYDNQGTELHCLKTLHQVTNMEFLPYHFLLATCSDSSFVSWLDISIGEIVAKYNTNFGRLRIMTQNPYNAVLCLGHSNGVVTMWSPSCKEPLVKMLCHKSPLSALHVDPKGVYMATAGVNKEIKIWDVRKLDDPLQAYKLHSPAANLNFSQKNMLAVGMGNCVDVYRDCCAQKAVNPYLRHRFNAPIGNFGFCPFEDVLGVATGNGFSSLIVPGSGEANFDALEVNPYQTKSQRQESEVKALLEKIPADLITLDPAIIGEVDVPTFEDKIEMKKKLLFLKPPKIIYQPRNKMKGRGGTAKMSRNKKIVKEKAKREFLKNVNEVKMKVFGEKKTIIEKTGTVLDRFLPKK